MRAKTIMIQGTGSSVGKSLITAALCRIFHQDGYNVAPFKSQNMALNSYVTKEGGEMGRAQVVQAQACGIEPSVAMNPILLKPSSDIGSQVIINGRVYGNMTASQYQAFKPQLKDVIMSAYTSLTEQYDIVVIEGAGSPAEINLKNDDIVNMGMAEIADAPVLLIGDIDKGGVFASIAGTMLLLDHSERRRIKGVIINKFRGDVSILQPGLNMLTGIIHRPVLGVVPFIHTEIDEEDGATDRFAARSHKGLLDIAVVYVPHIANFTDFEPLRSLPDVDLHYVPKPEDLGMPDLLILPGTKNTTGDMLYIKRSGWGTVIADYIDRGGYVMGICGGFQMSGNIIRDPLHVESDIDEIEGLKLLDVETTMDAQKITAQAVAEVTPNDGPLTKGLSGMTVNGYEIHKGRTSAGSKAYPFTSIFNRTGEDVEQSDGFMDATGHIIGTYLHGIFDNDAFTHGIINALKNIKGMQAETISGGETFAQRRERMYDELADVVRGSIDMDAVYEILGI
ncbi:cobyric acid synthase [Mahella sp.]|uniref:cobyric acid synthase n=1 Tax=Mahella sp. TaxID=2798721 RepID=UPI0025C1B062|nr:cobyric acid synthase [Mahella sp.]MBZ4666293.1 cobyric acid synthase CobQ [Mahella sp.]MDK2903268.1 adenosylcobyric acid synthase [Clostridiales bacterium]